MIELNKKMMSALRDYTKLANSPMDPHSVAVTYTHPDGTKEYVSLPAVLAWCERVLESQTVALNITGRMIR